MPKKFFSRPVKLKSASDHLGLTLNVHKNRVFVVSVAPGSAGRRAGFVVGNIVTHIDDKKITSPEQLIKYVTARKAQNGKTSFTFTVSADKMPDATQHKQHKQYSAPFDITVMLKKESESLGLTMDLYTAAKNDKGSSSSSQSGQVLVASVRKGCAAARAGLVVGQLLTHVNGIAVSHPSKAVAAIVSGRKKRQTEFKFIVCGSLSAAQIKARDRAVRRAKKAVKKISNGNEKTSGKNKTPAASRDTKSSKTKTKVAVKASVTAVAPVARAPRPPPPPMPTRPPTAYLLYVAERRPQIQAEHPDLPFSKLRKLAGDKCKSEWASLSKTRAKKFEKKAAELNAAYEKDLVAYFSNEQNQSEANPYGVMHVSRKLKQGEVPTGEFLASFKRRVRKARRLRKDPNLPKRPHSAYIFFVNELRPKLIKENPDWPFLELAKTCGRKWKSISKTQLAKYEKLAAAAKAKYKKTLKAYLASNEHKKFLDAIAERDAKLAETARREAAIRARTSGFLPADATEAEIKAEKRRRRRVKRQKKDPNLPKRFKSAFLFFVAENRNRIRTEYPTAAFVDIGRICGEQWKALPGWLRKKYFTKAAKDKIDYDRRLEAYLGSDTRQKWEAEQEAERKREAEIDAKFVLDAAMAVPANRSKRGFMPGFAGRAPVPSTLGKRVNAKRDPNMPKRPESAYNLYTASVRLGVIKKHRGRPQHEIEAILGQQWKELTTSQRAKFETAAQAAKEGHRARLAEYLASDTRKEWERQVAALTKLPKGIASVDRVVKLARAESSMGLVVESYVGTGTKWSWLRGVAIILVAKGAAADLSGIAPGNILTHVNGVAVSDPAQTAHELARAKSAGAKEVIVSLSPRTVPKKVLAKMASKALHERKRMKPMYVPVATANVPAKVTIVDGPVHKLTLRTDNQPMGLVLGNDPSGKKGAYVNTVNKKSVASSANFKVGELVIAINGIKISSSGDAVAVMSTLRKKGVLTYVFTLSGGGTSKKTTKKRKSSNDGAGASSGKAAKRGRVEYTNV